MALPTDANFQLLVSDEVRSDPSGKLNVIGLFPTRDIRIDPTAALPVSLNLAFTFILGDGAGDFRTAMRILDPMGQELHKGELPAIRKPAGQGASLSVTISAIPIKVLGNYSVILLLDAQPYLRTIRIFQ